jgi:FtsH-binding integral membrane protein
MIVPNFVPDPIEVPGNVTQLKYRERLVFIRRVSLRHFASILWVALVAAAPLPVWRLGTALGLLLGCLLILSIVRIALRGKPMEAIVSAAFLPFLLTLVGIAADCLTRHDIPVWAAAISVGCAVTYTALCGRDFSFVGQFVLAGLVSSVIVAAVAGSGVLTHGQAWVAMLWNLVFLFYYCYDLASLLSRRRKHEEWAAVVDLYRDVLNVFGWVVRVVQHWYRHKIFTLPLIEPRISAWPLPPKGPNEV